MMNNRELTKEKWSYETVTEKGCHAATELYINSQSTLEFACVYCEEEIPNEQEMKIAKLIAAAPDLLEALLNIENDNGSIPLPIWEMRNKAINKALGNEQ